jgi:hypothetical protein
MIEIPEMDAQEQNTWLRGLLSTGIFEVTFAKVDGEMRTMPCTLDEQYLPKVEVKEGKTKKEPKNETLSVWCTDKQEWRSFRVLNLVSIRELT